MEVKRVTRRKMMFRLLGFFFWVLVGFGRPPLLFAEDPVYTISAGTKEEGWEGTLSLNAVEFQDGDDLHIGIHLEIRSEMLSEKADIFDGLFVSVFGERLYDEKGRFHQFSNASMSTVLTPSGLPIENYQWEAPSARVGGLYTTPIDLVKYIPRETWNLRNGKMILFCEFTVGIGRDIPAGYYRLHVNLLGKIDAIIRDFFHLPVYLGLVDTAIKYKKLDFLTSPLPELQWGFFGDTYIPLMKIKNPATPKMVWTLFTQMESNGIRGIVAEEDKSNFAISHRTKFPNRFITNPGTYLLEPDFPTEFRRVVGGSFGGVALIPDHYPRYIHFSTGELSVTVVTPDGEKHDLGKAPFVGSSNAGATTSNRRFHFPFEQWGLHKVIMTGWIQEANGFRMEGGGTYEIWIARKLTFSTGVKPGTPFLVGNTFPMKAQIHPDVPADVRYTIDFFPLSRKEDKRVVLAEGKANRFGYFFPSDNSPSMKFEQPGEYASDLFVHYRDEEGDLWVGSQMSAGVVARPDSLLVPHGLKYPVVNGGDQGTSFEARFKLERESSASFAYQDSSNCKEAYYPYYSGDVLYVATSFDGTNNIAGYMSQEMRDPALREEICRVWGPHGNTEEKIASAAEHFANLGYASPLGYLRSVLLGEVWYTTDIGGDADMLPVLFRNNRGYQPFCYPEGNRVINYYYSNAIRPGFSAFVQVADATAFQSYWHPSPEKFGGQINSGINGDLPGEIYRLQGGVVYRDLDKGISEYGAYASTLIVQPYGSYSNRVVSPVEEPLFELNGRDHYLFAALETSGVYEVGEAVELGCMIFPAVPAHVEYSVLGPEGDIYRFDGFANSLGIFTNPRGRYTFQKPGVYEINVELSYNGKKGDIVGSGNGTFHHYVVPENPEHLLNIHLPKFFHVDPASTLEIPLSIPSNLRNASITYSTEMPGVLMDKGKLQFQDHRCLFRFRPAQFGMQYSNYDTVDFMTGEPYLADSVFFVFYLEAEREDGSKVFDVKKLMIRGIQGMNL